MESHHFMAHIAAGSHGDDVNFIDADMGWLGENSMFEGGAVGDVAMIGVVGEGESNCSLKTSKDRGKILVSESERKRRVSMKEKLYELRSLVPTITKMDKASIVTDAIIYVKDLQSQAKKLEEEIVMLQCSSSELEDSMHQISSTRNMIPKSTMNMIPWGKIVLVKACKVGEERFYVTVEGNVEYSGANHVSSLSPTSSLYMALESLSCFNLENSNFSLTNQGFLFTMTINAGNFAKEVNAYSMELRVMGALLREGFQLMQATTTFT